MARDPLVICDLQGNRIDGAGVVFTLSGCTAYNPPSRTRTTRAPRPLSASALRLALSRDTQRRAAAAAADDDRRDDAARRERAPERAAVLDFAAIVRRWRAGPAPSAAEVRGARTLARRAGVPVPLVNGLGPEVPSSASEADAERRLLRAHAVSL